MGRDYFVSSLRSCLNPPIRYELQICANRKLGIFAFPSYRVVRRRYRLKGIKENPTLSVITSA